MFTISKVIVFVWTLSPLVNDTGMAFFPSASIFFPPKPYKEFALGSSVRFVEVHLLKWFDEYNVCGASVLYEDVM